MHLSRRSTRTLALVAFCSLSASPASAQRGGGRTPVPDVHPARLLTAAQLQELDRYILNAMEAWGIPGVAVAIVQGDSVMMAKGFGVKELGKPDRVDPHTLFAIGSNTKTTTASLIAMLVDEGKMRWDDPVWKYLPGFRVADPYVSREATIRDLLSHRTDLENDNAVWYGSTLTRAQLIDKLRFLKQESGFRSRYSYNNLMVAVAGDAAAAAAGTTWENLIQQRIFTPLGMTSSLTSSHMLTAESNVAAPHMTFRGQRISIPHRDASNVGPAGSVYSSVADLAQYLRMHLGNGLYKGKRLISESSEAQMRTLVSPTGNGPTFRTDTTDSFLGYGLGWYLDDFRGHPTVGHVGAIDGMLSELRMLPNEQVGVVVLTNYQPHSMHPALIHHIFDVVLGLPQRPWDARLRGGEAPTVAMAADVARPAHPSVWLPLDKYAGTYSDSLNGDLKVLLQDGRLMLTYHPGFTAVLEPWQFNTFLVDWQQASLYSNGQHFATFSVDSNGRPTEVNVNMLGVFHAANDGARR
jgi:CubicO group peptidase (beta-lactamase class C family)